MKSKKVNLGLDIVLVIGLAMAMIPGITGGLLHQGLGITLGVGLVVHHLLHWKWLVAMVESFTRLDSIARFKLALNTLSLLAFSLTIASGLMNAVTLSGDSSTGIVIQRSDSRFTRHGLLPRQASRELARPTLGHGNAGFHWHVIHHAGALLTFLTVALHLALHRRWITGATKRFTPKSPSIREVSSLEGQ